MTQANEWYARDSSRKIQAIFKSRMQEGKRVSPSVPYGYRRDPQDKQHLIVDEEAAAVVRRVYQMVIDGYGVNGIADILTADKVLIPAAYHQTGVHGAYHFRKNRYRELQRKKTPKSRLRNRKS